MITNVLLFVWWKKENWKKENCLISLFIILKIFKSFSIFNLKEVYFKSFCKFFIALISFHINYADKHSKY